MLFFITKIFITAIIVVVVAEVAKRSSLFAGLIVSIPLTTFLALVWVYWESKDVQKIIELSNSTLLMLIPSTFFFIFLPVLIKLNLSFTLSMIFSVSMTALCYYIFILILNKIGLAGF
jgi:hypothetical protein